MDRQTDKVSHIINIIITKSRLLLPNHKVYINWSFIAWKQSQVVANKIMTYWNIHPQIYFSEIDLHQQWCFNLNHNCNTTRHVYIKINHSSDRYSLWNCSCLYSIYLPDILHQNKCWHHWILKSYSIKLYIDGLVQDCSNSIANTLELLQTCTEPWVCLSVFTTMSKIAWYCIQQSNVKWKQSDLVA